MIIKKIKHLLRYARQRSYIPIRHTLLRRSPETLLTFGLRPKTPQGQLLVVYAGYSLLGTLLLMLPWSITNDISFVDNLFTVVSAISTTGLITVNPATDYTFLGQAFILLLIQMGGLGYMTLSSYIMLRITRHLGRSKYRLFNAQFAFPDTIDSASMLRSIVNFMFLFETLGVVLLYPYFLSTDVDQPLWSAIFHTVSAFCKPVSASIPTT